MSSITPLSAIIAYARAGAQDYAWRQFLAGGYDQLDNDAIALSVKGRLLKDRAIRSGGASQRRLYLDSARAYAAAASLDEDVYPLINAATLSLLGGSADQSQRLAAIILHRIADGSDNSETPYYREATRAEALLLCGRDGDAQVAIGSALAIAPRAWEDHASTLRQFALILHARGEDAAWLDSLRPPRSVHFAGHLAVAADGPGHDAARSEIDALLDQEKVGFGYGALAAGADIVIAEALIARGAELHVVLPGGIGGFRAQSVEPFGEAWRNRFEAVLEQADTVRSIPPREGPLTDAGIRLATEVAMGAALMNARRLATEAIQLLVVDGEAAPVADGGGTAHAATVWNRNGHRQHRVTAPREGVAGALPQADAEGAEPVLAAMLAIETAPAALADAAAAAAADEALRRLRETLEGAEQIVPPQLLHGQLAIALVSPAAAARLVEAIRAAWPDGSPPRMGAAYGICHAVADPFAETRRLHGRPALLAIEAMRSTPPGSTCVSENFAMALEAEGAAARTEFVGELAAPEEEAPIGLYSLTPLPASVR